MNNSSQASGVVKKGQVKNGIAKFEGEIHRRPGVNKENAVNGNVLKTPSGKRISRLPLPKSAGQRSAGENMLTTPSRRMPTSSTQYTPGMASLMEELNSNLDRSQEELMKSFQSNTDMLANISTKGFNDVNKSLALQHSSQKIHNRNVDGKLDKMDDLLSEFDRRTAEMQVMLQQLSERKADVPSSITASTAPSSAMTSVRSILFSNDDVTPSAGSSTLSKPTLSKPTLSVVPPSTKTTNSQSIENILLGEELEKSHAVNAVLQQQLRSANVKMEQQDKRLRSMTTPGRDVMDIKPTPAKHSERTKKSINKAVVTARGGNKNRDIAPTRRSTRTRFSVQKEP